VVVGRVLPAQHKLNVIRTIVGLISIHMVGDLVVRQKPAKFIFENNSMQWIEVLSIPAGMRRFCPTVFIPTSLAYAFDYEFIHNPVGYDSRYECQAKPEISPVGTSTPPSHGVLAFEICRVFIGEGFFIAA
jgi:hypothetical protein